MKIYISDKKKISSVQKEFNDAFPFLRLEFFSKPPHALNGSARQFLISESNKTIGICRKVHTNKHINIVPTMSVNKLEQIFSETFGLFVQVFRQSGRVWLETTRTDDWTLAEQNKQGEELSKYHLEKEKPFPADDYHDVE
jgi:hypothetical protein